MPQYNMNRVGLFQEGYNKLDAKEVLARPEDVNVVVEDLDFESPITMTVFVRSPPS